MPFLLSYAIVSMHQECALISEDANQCLIVQENGYKCLIVARWGEQGTENLLGLVPYQLIGTNTGPNW